jgi:hypothetical protein
MHPGGNRRGMAVEFSTATPLFSSPARFRPHFRRGGHRMQRQARGCPKPSCGLSAVPAASSQRPQARRTCRRRFRHTSPLRRGIARGVVLDAAGKAARGSRIAIIARNQTCAVCPDKRIELNGRNARCNTFLLPTKARNRVHHASHYFGLMPLFERAHSPSSGSAAAAARATLISV